MKKILTVLLVVTLVLSTTSVALATVNRNHNMAKGIGTHTAPVFSDIPDDYCEYGYPIFYITVSPEEWGEIFLYHPFYQGQTSYEYASFIFISDTDSRSSWCHRCGDRVIIEARWVIGRNFLPNCPASTIRNAGSPGGADILEGWTFETRYLCHLCGWATHPWNSQWQINFNNQHLWTWIIDCSNWWTGREEEERSMSSSTTTVIVGGSIRRGHSAHQAISFRNPIGTGRPENLLGVVHGFNCQIECGRLC